MSDDVKILSRSDFIAATQLKRELVPVPELGGSVYISELYTAQILSYNERLQKMVKRGQKNVDPYTSIELMALLVSMSACDANGKPLFTEADAKALAKSNVNALLNLSVRIMQLSGLNSKAIDEVSANLKKAPEQSGDLS